MLGKGGDTKMGSDFKKKDKVSLHSTFTVQGEKISGDTRFLDVTIDVLHTGLNENESFFSKEVVDDNATTIKNTPILGFIKSDNFGEDFQGHEYSIVNGEEVYYGHAYGVIPESCNPRWITKATSDGEKEFLQVDGLLWTKFNDSISIFERDLEKKQSMELDLTSIEGYEDDDGIFHFTYFRFDGCCALGNDPRIQPAMTGANIQVNFTMDDFIDNVSDEIKNKLEVYTNIVDNDMKGGNKKMSYRNYTTLMQQYEDMSNIISNYATTTNKWGDSFPRFSLYDVQNDEAIVIDRENNWEFYSFKFTMNGDKPEIDFSNCTRKIISFEDYKEGEPKQSGFTFGKEINDIMDSAFSKIQEAENKFTEADKAKKDVESNYTSIKAEYDEIKPKYDAYVKAEQEAAAAEIKAGKEEMFSRFEKELADNAEFTALKDKIDEIGIDEIEQKCSLLYARKVFTSNDSKKDDVPTEFTKKVKVMDDDNNGNDSIIHTKYGDIRKSK